MAEPREIPFARGQLFLLCVEAPRIVKVIRVWWLSAVAPCVLRFSITCFVAWSDLLLTYLWAVSAFTVGKFVFISFFSPSLLLLQPSLSPLLLCTLSSCCFPVRMHTHTHTHTHTQTPIHTHLSYPLYCLLHCISLYRQQGNKMNKDNAEKSTVSILHPEFFKRTLH